MIFCNQLKRKVLFGNKARLKMEQLPMLSALFKTLADRNCHVLHLFTVFVEYNNPERLKHKKRLSSPLCTDTMKSHHSQRHFGNLQHPFLVEVRMECTEVDLLAKALAKYAELKRKEWPHFMLLAYQQEWLAMALLFSTFLHGLQYKAVPSYGAGGATAPQSARPYW